VPRSPKRNSVSNFRLTASRQHSLAGGCWLNNGLHSHQIQKLLSFSTRLKIDGYENIHRFRVSIVVVRGV
jgi:hypothetical protein